MDKWQGYEGKHPEEISIKEAVTLLGKSARTIRRRVEQGQLPAKHVKGKHGLELRFNREILEDLSNREGGHAPANDKGLSTVDKDDKGSLLEAQLADGRTREERLWREKEEAVKQWHDQFQYNLTLLQERKLLAEGQEHLRAEFHREKQALVRAYEKQLESKSFQVTLLSWASVLLLLGGVLGSLLLTGYIKIEIPSLQESTSISAAAFGTPPLD